MSTLRDLWLRWKMLKLPWRRTVLIGQDLQGNTYWEFLNKLSPPPNRPSTIAAHPQYRPRRIVRPRNRTHMSDVDVSPQWHQWLRQTRRDPPTIREQQEDVLRKRQLAHGAMLADRRWEAKERYIDAPTGSEGVRIGGQAEKRTGAHVGGQVGGGETRVEGAGAG